jgi:NADP-dependent 3-hydroxy acid dehydrogenase YdfG
MSVNNLSEKVAVVTGGSSGIGLAVAKELRTQGFRLVLNARREERLAEVCADLKATPLTGDVTDPTLPQRLLELALSTYGRCDVIVNNAGLIEVGPIASIDIERVCRMVQVNVEAAYRVAYTFVRHFLEQDHGNVINMSSVLGTKVRATAGAYAGTKYAIEALSEALRMELAGTSVGVACIEPGLVMTDLHSDWPVHPSESMDITNALQPEDIARAVAFVLSQPGHVRIPRLMILPGEHQV